MAAAVIGVLLVGAGGYGYHRDALYFLAAADHLAWGYADQGPLTPTIAHVMSWLAPGSLVVLRIPSALMVGITVFLSGAIGVELGGSRRAQLIAASCTAVGSFALFVGHVLSTSTFDLPAWAMVTWLVVRVIRTKQNQLWLAVDIVAGVALLNKPLIAFLLVALAAGFLVAGPRDAFDSGSGGRVARPRARVSECGRQAEQGGIADAASSMTQHAARHASPAPHNARAFATTSTLPLRIVDLRFAPNVPTTAL